MTGQIFVLSRDRVIFSVRFASVVQNVLDVEVGDPLPRNCVTDYEFCLRGIPVNQTRTNLGAERMCKNGSSEGSGRNIKIHVPCQAITDNSFPHLRG